MRRLLLFCLVICSLTANAKTVSEMFISMPDTMLPYMTAAQRTEIIGMKTINPDSTVTLSNTLGTVSIKKLTDDMLTTYLSQAVTLEIGRLSDNRFVVIKTYGGQDSTGSPTTEKESTVFTCDSLWQHKKVMDPSKVNFFTDSATIEQRKMVEFPLIEAHLADSPKTIVMKLNAPMLSADDRKELSKVITDKHVECSE